jgi:hypothetical protein
MSTGDLPTFLDTGHSHTVYGMLPQGGLNQLSQFAGSPTTTMDFSRAAPQGQAGHTWQLMPHKQQLPQPQPQKAKPVSRRLVKVIIVDPDDNIPLDQCVLYSGLEQLTDLNDQELFFALDIRGMLAEHNQRRVLVINKKVKERTEYLEPAKVRDLKMVVATVAEF